MKKKHLKSKQPKQTDKDMMESCNISPWYSVGKILQTSTKPKEDVFDSFRPNRPCVEYKISETWTKMQRGDLKVNVRQTSATYEEIPPEICKPPRKKKLKLFSGGPPQWKFIDELWKEQMEESQKQLKVEQRRAVQEVHQKRAHLRQNAHQKIQRLVGPDWFMELSPQQLEVVDQLRQGVLLDLRNNSIENCQDILAALGLVLRPNPKQIFKALQHSCGCPVEFLLVLYQIVNPSRETYSLNDRLLLSAVVHLSITQTLRELHVRIPSPPKAAKKLKESRKKSKKITYQSPYLEPQTFEPAPPKFTGVYKNKHKQYPDSPYFSYLPYYRLERELHGTNFDCSLTPEEDQKTKVSEYNEAQNFFTSLPGAKEQMLILLPPTFLQPCQNILLPTKQPSVTDNVALPTLCKVSSSEAVICFCEENSRKRNPNPRSIKRSCCEKSAQKFLQSLCLCDDCLEKVASKNLVRLHGGFVKPLCSCDDPVPIIQGTLLNKTCLCYKEYRDRIVGAAARQYLADQKYHFVVGGVVSTKFGPVYNLHSALGDKICLCGEIKRRKQHIDALKQTLRENRAKYTIAGVVMTKIGPVYYLTAVVARRPCRCVVKYTEKLKVLKTQNELRKIPYYFVNNGLIIAKPGPIFHLSNVARLEASKDSEDLREVCSCEIKKPKCYSHCLDYFEYNVSKLSSSSEEERNVSESSSSHASTTTTSLSSASHGEEINCPYCSQPLQRKPRVERNCQHGRSYQDSSVSESQSTTGESDEESESSSNDDSSPASSNNKAAGDFNTDTSETSDPKPCKCKDELDRFMNTKCPCEECNRRIRQSYATYVVGGTRTTSSGNQIKMVHGIQQHLCGCMKDHLERVRKVDEYKSRVRARYNLKKQPKKFCISGVCSTPDGPVYIISGVRPPVECECAKAFHEKEEKERFEKQRAKMPETGRIKYEIAGVKAMPDENVYIMSRALKVSKCDCEILLSKFENAHQSCMEEYKNYLKKTGDEIAGFDDEDRRETLLNMEDVDLNVRNNTISTFLDMEDVNFDENQSKSPDVGRPLEQSTPTKPSFIEDEHEENKIDLDQEKRSLTNSKQSGNQRRGPTEESSDFEEGTSSEDDSSSSESSLTRSEDVASECGSCHVECPREVKPITLQTDKALPESFLSKRFAIFRKFPTSRKKQMQVLIHILEEICCKACCTKM